MSSAQRSAHMAKIRSKDTKPEMILRRMLHRAGFRYRLHDRLLPGKPDLVFAGRRKVVFVNGCFWHGHSCAVGSRVPKSNTEFWLEKRRRNRQRDVDQRKQLALQGWSYLDIWECEIAANEDLVSKVATFLNYELS